MIGADEIIVGIDCEHDRDMPLASSMLRTLVDHYPGYPWLILIRGGVVQIKVSTWSPDWGMALHYSDVAHDATIRDRALVRSAGEFLERANMVRGRRTGDKLFAIEGVPDKALTRAKLLGA